MVFYECSVCKKSVTGDHCQAVQVTPPGVKREEWQFECHDCSPPVAPAEPTHEEDF